MVVDLFLLPYDSGRHAVRMGAGPASLVEAGLAEELRAGGYEVVEHTLTTSLDFPTEAAVAFDLARSLAPRVHATRRAGRFPLVLAGNCFGALGVVAGLRDHSSLGVIWLDAHGDFNTPETSRSAFLDGMASAVLVGWCWSAAASSVQDFTPVAESSYLLVGARDLDAEEAARLARSRVTMLAPGSLRSEGQLTSALDRLARTAAIVYLHVDLDVLDAVEVGTANGYACPGGLSVEDVVWLVRRVGGRFDIGGATLSAYDPWVDADGRVRRAAMVIAAQIVTSAASRPGREP